MFHDEPDYIFFWLGGHALRGFFGFQVFVAQFIGICWRQSKEVVKIGQGRTVPRIFVGRFLLLLSSLLPKVSLRVNVLLDREHSVQEPLYLMEAVFVLIAPDALGVERSSLHHAAVRAREIGIVLEEIAMP